MNYGKPCYNDYSIYYEYTYHKSPSANHTEGNKLNIFVYLVDLL